MYVLNYIIKLVFCVAEVAQDQGNFVTLNEPMPGPKPWRKNSEGGNNIHISVVIDISSE